MATYREIVYLCLDELKLVSDDSHFQEEHIIFLADKIRVMLIKQRYSDIRKEIPDSNYQTVCVDLEETNAINGNPCEGSGYMKSVKKIPKMLEVGGKSISSLDFFQGNIAYVSNERFKFVGYNRFLQNQIYGTIAPDSYLYLRSNNPQLYYLEKVKVTGIFEDSTEVTELQCPDEEGNTTCDIMDMTFPIEAPLIPTLIELIVKELGGQKYQSSDDINNSSDDLSNLASYIRQQLANGRRSDLYKDYS